MRAIGEAVVKSCGGGAVLLPQHGGHPHCFQPVAHPGLGDALLHHCCVRLRFLQAPRKPGGEGLIPEFIRLAEHDDQQVIDFGDGRHEHQPPLLLLLFPAGRRREGHARTISARAGAQARQSANRVVVSSRRRVSKVGLRVRCLAVYPSSALRDPLDLLALELVPGRSLQQLAPGMASLDPVAFLQRLSPPDDAA